jgi:hypothetical protein
MDARTGLSSMPFWHACVRFPIGCTCRGRRSTFPRTLGLFFVHRIEAFTGLYVLVRDEARLDAFRAACATGRLGARRVERCRLRQPPGLLPGRHPRKLLQEIAGDSAFSLGMVADFARTLEEDGAWRTAACSGKPLIGQVLYLEAEAAACARPAWAVTSTTWCIGCSTSIPPTILGRVSITLPSAVQWTTNG